MLQIRIQVTGVDRHGFLGRDHHPTNADIGQRGWVTGMVLVPDETVTDQQNLPVPLQQAYQAVDVVLDGGRRVTLLGHEFELLSCVHNEGL